MGNRNLKWQPQFRDVLQRYCHETLKPRIEFCGRPLHTILVHAVTGAGKSRAASIAMQELKGKIDQFVVLVPRNHLVEQQVGKMDSTVAYDPKRYIDPFRGHKAIVLTYQRNTQITLGDAIVGSLCLILDEGHHLRDGDPHADRGWLLAARELAKKADLVILLTGTLSRPVGRIAFAEYEARADGSEYPRAKAENIIRYSRADALTDFQIKPLSFRRSDGEVRWTTDGVQAVDRRLSQIMRRDQSIAVKTVLTTGHAKKLLRSCLDHWSRRDFGKVLVVCHRASKARQYFNQWKSIYKCELSVSEDGKDAKDALGRFKHGNAEVLFSVAMCHEGLDVEQITHICFLSDVRWSLAWIEQCFGRAIRVCDLFGPWDDQRGYIFVPDDPALNVMIDKIRSEQPMALSTDNPSEPGRGGNGGLPPRDLSDAQPLGSDVDSIASSDLDATHPENSDLDAVHAAVAKLGGHYPRTPQEALRFNCYLSSFAMSMSGIEIPKRFTDAENLKSLGEAFELTVADIVENRGLSYAQVNGYLKRQLNPIYGERESWAKEGYLAGVQILMRQYPQCVLEEK